MSGIRSQYETSILIRPSRKTSFPSATPNPSLDPVLHEGPTGTSLPGSLNGAVGTGTRMRIPLERR